MGGRVTRAARRAGRRCINPWSDAEKLIFADAFLQVGLCVWGVGGWGRFRGGTRVAACQFPKDFDRIASFLVNKSVSDCVAFYYDTKCARLHRGAGEGERSICALAQVRRALQAAAPGAGACRSEAHGAQWMVPGCPRSRLARCADTA